MTTTNDTDSTETDDSPNWRVVEAGTGGKTIGKFDTRKEAREYVEDRFGTSPAPANGRTIWKGDYRTGHGRYILKLRKI